MRITFFGTGTSHGIPVIGCRCEVCLSSDPRDKRDRTGVWLHDERHSVVVDVSVDFRRNALRHGLARLDAALITHGHSDHIGGLDDLRIFSQVSGRPTVLYGAADTFADVRKRFDYAFAPPKAYGGGAPQYDLREVEGPFDLAAGQGGSQRNSEGDDESEAANGKHNDGEGNWKVTPLPVLHGPEPILGYRVNDFAFITDVTEIPDATIDLLKGVKVLALDCLRDRPHSTHLHFDKSVEYAKRIGAGRTYFIHMAHELGHAATEARLPPEIRLAYDGLTVEL